jgi:hypothetical protein
MKIYKKVLVMSFVWLLILLTTSTGWAAPLPQTVVCEQEIIVQADDWLSKIAEKVYGDVFAYPAIAEVTNAKHAEDDSFAQIDNVDLIEIGWKLCAPSAAEAQAMLGTALETPQVTTAPVEVEGEPVGRLVLATTTSTENSGLLEVILPDFEQWYGAEVEVIAVGTGQAIQLGENGDADVILVHARSQEDTFVEAGYGVNRQDVMYNDFVILGSASDPANIGGMTDAVAALTQIAESQTPFISRGDDSGTHTKEQTLWQASTSRSCRCRRTACGARSDSPAGRRRCRPRPGSARR